MTRDSPLTWRLAIASLSLLIAIAVYCFARLHPPLFFEPVKTTSQILAAQTWIFGSAPSLFYTLSIGLLIGACASTLRSAKLHCLLWITLASILELLQLPTLSRPLSTWLASILSETNWEIIRPYWARGVFDPLDMLATFTGGLIALLLLSCLPGSKQDVSG